MNSILRCAHLLIFTLVLGFCIASVRAEDKPAQKAPSDPPTTTKPGNPEKHTFIVSEIREVRLDATRGRFTFIIGDVHYAYAPEANDGSGAKVATCIAVLAELRRVKSFEAFIVNVSNDSKHFEIRTLIIPIGELK